VVRDKKREIYTVRYEAVNAVLLNEFLKEHGKVQTITKASRSPDRRSRLVWNACLQEPFGYLVARIVVFPECDISRLVRLQYI